jgi:DNA replication ATP-dependent helicase Dna2
LIEETYDVSSLSAIIENIIKDKSIIQDLYGANISTQEIKKSVMPFVNFVKMFVDKYKPLSKGKKPSSESGWSRNLQNKNAWDGSIDYIIDIEENIWSPSLGMKGRIDITTVVISI